MLGFLAALVLLFSPVAHLVAYRMPGQETRPRWSAAECGSPCFVFKNNGGRIDLFEDAARDILRTGRLLVIDGPCRSACTIAADIARKNVCITRRAVMGFHNGTEHHLILGPRRISVASYYRQEIVDWVEAHGGFPGRDVGDNTFLNMPYSDARRFWRTCGPRGNI